MTNNSFEPKVFGGSPFSYKNRLLRFVWGGVEGILYKWSPRPFHAWRCFLLRMFGAKVGRRCHVYPGVKFWAPWNLVIGDDVGIGDGAFIYAMNKILIGDRSIVSQEVFLCGGTHDYRKASHPLQSFPISIGSDCWLAARVFVHPGVAIPDGVVVGACSVVTSDLPKWSVCTGNPCKYIKPRDYDN